MTDLFRRSASGLWVNRAGKTPPGGGGGNPGPGSPKWAGHEPGRVLWGYCVGEGASTALPYSEAQTYSGTLYARRSFGGGGWITASKINTWLDETTAEDQYPWISFKVPGNDWAGVIAGSYDAELDILKARAAARPEKWMFSVHHEPNGDGNLVTWANMQKYISNYVADVSDKVCFTPIANGFFWAPKQWNQADPKAGRSAIESTNLIATLNANNHMLACDTYENNGWSNPLQTDAWYDANGDRSYKTFQSFIDWCRLMGVNACGIGEWGGTTALAYKEFWNTAARNSDIVGIALLFNSSANTSTNSWLLVPDGWVFPDRSQAWKDGNANTQGKLDYWKQARDLSVSSTPGLIN